ncbi:SusD/RagB family nutrient-binding outer membrane lipoprotein [Sphingobacterium sp. lm-10]|uniref:SusD/RagB family nutrient-binding outer membrane lipoprotein n=1 Tax=Sphingobacterium sp. lm-10 TaxID=2944904 RepID=UPI0020227613|nr:SusD/RagB family nutrient-binding outer membrane lipoprotein [Sphingobacterium sp. lm-10]MCL7987845.1 SusD/RagB family nutrient-binding outer membrane lipoprotein [Sphingobacterium sp. lm-10]
MTTLKIFKYFTFALVAQATIMGCSRDKFAEYNTDPDAVLNPPVDYLFTQAVIMSQDNDMEAFYDNYSYVSRWSRVFLQVTGNSLGVTDNAANANNRYGKFFEDVGPLLEDVQRMIDRMPDDERARNTYKRAIPSVVKAWQAWYVSDVNGSIPYTEAFQSRYGGTLRPKYETQDELFTIFDRELKEAATILSTPQPVEQFSYGNQDLYFGGDAAKWAKAANSLRLMIALRLMKRDPARLQAIVQDVLSHPAGLISSSEEDWSLKARINFTQGGNWNITGNGRLFVGESGVVDYMWNNEDPRLRFFFRPNQWSELNFQRAKDQGVIPATAVFNPRRYYGQFSNPEAAEDPTKARFFAPLQIRDGENTITLDTVSRIQDRLFQPENDGGTGVGIFPVLTYADLCFIRAEIAQRGWSNENAGEWYTKGVEASLRFYDKLAESTHIVDYVPLTDAEINAFKTKPGIAYNAATGLEQIVLQSYLNYYRNFNEAWALVKRTGMPNKTTALVFEDWTNTGSVSQMPRRFNIGFPVTGEYNFDNKKAALDEMMRDPDFGEPSNILGRIWWDKQ